MLLLFQRSAFRALRSVTEKIIMCFCVRYTNFISVNLGENQHNVVLLSGFYSAWNEIGSYSKGEGDAEFGW